MYRVVLEHFGADRWVSGDSTFRRREVRSSSERSRAASFSWCDSEPRPTGHRQLERLISAQLFSSTIWPLVYCTWKLCSQSQLLLWRKILWLNCLPYCEQGRLTKRDRRRITCFSKVILPLRASSVSMHPRRPAEMQSFQNDVYPSLSFRPKSKTYKTIKPSPLFNRLYLFHQSESLLLGIEFVFFLLVFFIGSIRFAF